MVTSLRSGPATHEARLIARPVSRRGPHWRLRPLLLALAGLLLACATAGVLLDSPQAAWAVLPLAPLVTALVLRRRDTVQGDELVVRRLRVRRVDLARAVSTTLHVVQAMDHRVVELRVRDAEGRSATVPLWRTRSPRGVDAYACDRLADRLQRSPHVRAEVVVLLRAQARAVRTGERPTPLDRLVVHVPHVRLRRAAVAAAAPASPTASGTPVPGGGEPAAATGRGRPAPPGPGAGPPGPGPAPTTGGGTSTAPTAPGPAPRTGAAPPSGSRRTAPPRTSRTGSR